MPLPTFYNLPEEKRQKLLNCAIDEFAQHDYNSASITKIVSRAAIAKGSLYQYFNNKQDLHTYLLELVSQKKTEMFTTFKSPETGMSMFETLHQLFLVMVTFDVQYPKLSQIGYRAIHGNSPLPEEIMSRAKQSTNQYFRELIDRGKQHGEIRPDIDASMAAYIFSSALAGMSDYLRSRNIPGIAEDTAAEDPNRTAEIEKAFNQVVTLFQFGIANPSAGREK